MGAIRLRNLSKTALQALCLGLIPLSSGIATGQSIRDAVKFGEGIVCLNREGKFLAWDAVSGKSKPDLSAEFSKDKLERIGSNGRLISGIQDFRMTIHEGEAMK